MGSIKDFVLITIKSPTTQKTGFGRMKMNNIRTNFSYNTSQFKKSFYIFYTDSPLEIMNSYPSYSAIKTFLEIFMSAWTYSVSNVYLRRITLATCQCVKESMNTCRQRLDYM
jgi:hypothetical protein